MEVCVDSLQSALNAFKGGASRIELCSSLNDGGLTPSLGFYLQVKSELTIPIFIMIRPRPGYDFVYSPGDIQIMKNDIKQFKENGAEGFVFGALTKDRSIDVEACKILMEIANPLPVTFHRAFDLVADPFKSLDAIIDLGFSRVLSSGQKPSTEKGVDLIKKLVKHADNRLIIMPGGGINISNLTMILQETGVKEFHASASKQVEFFEKSSYVISVFGAAASSIKITDVELVKDLVSEYEKCMKKHVL
ncbi:copper homeostasis protein cutC homolog isoform X2 [Nilaparvata lugens]|nr:copper homeostasis protein cutC homolog isoform X2 [Nilaparvata lugens]